MAKIALLALTVASLDNHLVLLARCNYRPFAFIVVWCIARQTDRNGETVKHFQNCIKVLSQFRTPCCTNLQQYSNRPRRCAWQCTHAKLIIFVSNFSARKMCRPITLQSSDAIAMCRKVRFPQIVLLRYKVKPHLGFQNLGCHCKILGCHFDTQKRLKKTLPRLFRDVVMKCKCKKICRKAEPILSFSSEANMTPVKACAPRWMFSFSSANC